MITHQTTMMECHGCQHQWVAVHPVEAEYLCCPLCGHMTPAPLPVIGDRPSGLPRCAICDFFHELDDACFDPADFGCGEGEEWKK